MAYNPGISYRGEMLGQAIGQAGQSIAQSYGQGLRLQEEQKRYDDVMKQRRRDRKELKRSLGMQAELLGADKEDIDTMGLGELQGFVEGTKLQSSLEFQGLQLQQLQNDIEQTASGKKAIGQMQMYMEEQNLDAVTAATTAASDHGLELGEAAKLLNLATAGQKLGLELRQLGVSERIAGVQERQITRAEEADKRQDQPTKGRVIDVDGKKYHQVGDRIFEVEEDEQLDDPRVAGQGDAVMRQAETAYAEADQIATGGGADQVSGDERTIFGRSRYGRLGTQFSRLRQLNAKYRASTGKDHPQYTAFLDNVAPLVQHMRSNNRSQSDIQQMLQSIGFKTTINQMKAEGREKDAKELAAKFGVNLER